MRSRILRGLGAAALFAVAAVHLYEYYVDHYSAIPTIGVLFLLNAASATLVGVGLLAPVQRLAPRRLGAVALPALAAAGIGIAGTSLVALFVSESTPLFGFMESGYRLVVVVAIVAETAAILILGTLLLVLRSTDRVRSQSAPTFLLRRGAGAPPSSAAEPSASRTSST